MQGHRATVTSISELFDLDHGSPSSGNAALDQQLYWSNIQDPIEPRSPDTLPATTLFINPFIHDPQNFLDNQWYSQSSNPLSSNNVNLGPQSGQSSSSSRSAPVNLNVSSSGFVGQGSQTSPLVERPEIFKQSLSGLQWFQPSNSGSSSSAPYTVSSSGGAHFGEASGSRPVEGRVLPCKRKNFHLEGYTDQSSIAGSSSNAQNAESSSWNHANLGIQEQVEPRLVLGGFSRSTERLRRNIHQIINPSGVQNGSSTPGPYPTTAPPIAHSILPTSGFLAANYTNVPALPTPAIYAPVRPLPLSGFSVRWNGEPITTRPDSSSSAFEGSSSNVRNILEHPMFVSANESASTAFVQNPAVVRSVGAGAIRVPEHVGSGSRTGSHQASSSQNARRLQYPRRYSEYVRRALSAVGSDAAAARSNNPVLNPSAASQDVAAAAASAAAAAAAAASAAAPSRSGGHGRHWPLRSYLMERQGGGDNVVGVAYPARSLAAASERRRRFLSEIRNVLDMIRRGEALRYEDYMILDQSMFLGAMAGEAHDRHRDMRLDVDNMSYEELLALEERIGNVSTGASEETISTRLKQRKCVLAAGGSQSETTEPCCICQEEYNDGEDLGTLECGHEFHRDCIKQWLMQKNICPICKTTGLKNTT